MTRLQPRFRSASAPARRSLTGILAVVLVALALNAALAQLPEGIGARKCATAGRDARTAVEDLSLPGNGPVRLIRIHTRNIFAAAVTQQPAGPQSAETPVHPVGGHRQPFKL
jgi:hypothetical protein